MKPSPSEILLLQPRHIYAPAPDVDPIGHIYMPTSLLTAGSRLVAAGARVTILDENLTTCEVMPEVVGINLLGAPYVRAAIKIATRLRRQHANGTLLLGGVVVSGFQDEERSRLFGAAVNGNNDRLIEESLGLGRGALPAPEETSLIPAYELLSDDVMRRYLANEFGFYLSQGCRFSCSFCAAERTRRVPVLAPIRERYRDLAIVGKDLRYLIHRAQALGLKGLSIYLTNLDLFQSPRKLTNFASLATAILRDNSNFSLRMRALTNVGSFMDVHRDQPALIKMLAAAGLYRVGFGIDGATPSVWRAVRKPHRTATACVDAIRVAAQDYGLTPETLMVFGHNGADDAESLRLAIEFVSAMTRQYGAVPRPHVAKSVVPGNDGWTDPANRRTVNFLLSNPDAFQLLDFTALPSVLTHPDDDFRDMVSNAFVAVCSLEGTITQYVMPEDPAATRGELERARIFNLRRYDI